MDGRVATGACPEHATGHQQRVCNGLNGDSILKLWTGKPNGKEYRTYQGRRGRELLPMFLEWTSREFQRRIRSGSVGAKSADLLRQSIAMIPMDVILPWKIILHWRSCCSCVFLKVAVMVKEAKEKEGEYPLPSVRTRLKIKQRNAPFTLYTQQP